MSGIDSCDYLLQQATRRAKTLVGTGAIPAADWEDARQELLLDYLRRSSKFDRARGEWSGFVYGVMRNRGIGLIGRCRDREVLVQHIESVEGNDSTHSYDLTSAIELGLDVDRVLSGLTAQLRSLAHQLRELSIVEICLRTGKSRSGIYKTIGQLRRAFTAAGFYARPGRPSPSRATRQLDSRNHRDGKWA